VTDTTGDVTLIDDEMDVVQFITFAGYDTDVLHVRVNFPTHATNTDVVCDKNCQ